jgi:hypothetical protein
MHQFGAEHLEPLAQLFDQVVDIFFYVWRFANFIADVDIHLRPRITEEIP